MIYIYAKSLRSGKRSQWYLLESECKSVDAIVTKRCLLEGDSVDVVMVQDTLGREKMYEHKNNLTISWWSAKIKASFQNYMTNLSVHTRPAPLFFPTQPPPLPHTHSLSLTRYFISHYRYSSAPLRSALMPLSTTGRLSTKSSTCIRIVSEL